MAENVPRDEVYETRLFRSIVGADVLGEGAFGVVFPAESKEEPVSIEADFSES